MTLEQEILLQLTRRQFFSRTSKGIGIVALGSLLSPDITPQRPN